MQEINSFRVHFLAGLKETDCNAGREWLAVLISLSAATFQQGLPNEVGAAAFVLGSQPISYKHGSACRGQQREVCARLKPWLGVGVMVVPSLKGFPKYWPPSSEGGWADGQ